MQGHTKKEKKATESSQEAVFLGSVSHFKYIFLFCETLPGLEGKNASCSPPEVAYKSKNTELEVFLKHKMTTSLCCF